MAVEGLSAFQRKLALIPVRVTDAVKASLEKSAGELVAMMQRLVPRDSGDLARSIGWTWGAPPKGSVAVASVSSGNSTLTIYAGSTKAFYARWQEFGTTKMRANPFFFPAYRAMKRTIRTRANKAARDAIKAL